MKRRDFLIGSMGALATGVTGCAGIGQVIAPDWQNITPLQMDRFLTSLDGAMNQITENPEGGRFISELHQKPFNEKGARLLRQGMRTLLLAGNFGDLSVTGQVHPGVQKRLHYSAPEMDAAASDATDQMKSLSPTARTDMQTALRDDPALGDRVLKTIELEAAAVGASNRRLMQLHVMGKHIIGRLKHSSEMFINEYVTKYEKLTAVSGSAAETQRFMATRMGEAAFKARVREAENAARYWHSQELEDIPIGYRLVAQEGTNSESPSDNSEQEQRHQPLQLPQDIGKTGKEVKSGEKRSERLRRRGAYLLGIGAVTTAAGWLYIGVSGDSVEAVTIGLILGVTAGPILLLTGLFTLLVGGIIRANEGP